MVQYEYEGSMAGCSKQKNMICCRASLLACMLPETSGALLRVELNRREIQLISLENLNHSVDSELLFETYVDGFDCFIIVCRVDHNFIRNKET